MKTQNNMKKRSEKRLGRGLDALFGDEEAFDNNSIDEDVNDVLDDVKKASDSGKENGRMMLGIDQLEPGSYQPRRAIEQDRITELAESIAVHGVIQPILVRPKAGFDGMYEIIAGERRWRASQVAQLHEVPVIVKDMSDVEALEVGLIENLQREDLNAIEEALGYRQLMEEFGHTQEKVASGLGKSRSHVANMVRLLGLPSSVQDYIRKGSLSAGHARSLIGQERAESLAKEIIAKNMSVRDTEKLIRSRKSASAKTQKSSKAGSPNITKDADTMALEQSLSHALGLSVSIDLDAGSQTCGALNIKFKTLDQLDAVLGKLQS